MNIIIVAKAGAGKSAVAEALYNFLLLQGFNVDLRDEDFPHTRNLPLTYMDRLKLIRDRDVVIETRQAPRTEP